MLEVQHLIVFGTRPEPASATGTVRSTPLAVAFVAVPPHSLPRYLRRRFPGCLRPGPGSALGTPLPTPRDSPSLFVAPLNHSLCAGIVPVAVRSAAHPVATLSGFAVLVPQPLKVWRNATGLPSYRSFGTLARSTVVRSIEDLTVTSRPGRFMLQ